MAKGYRITEEQIATIKSMTANGATQIDIAEKVGLSKRSIANVQKNNHLKASTKWKFGETAEMDEVDKYKKVEKPIQNQKEIRKPEWVKLTEKVVTLTGTMTKFEYTIGLHDKMLKVNPGYSEEIELDLKDLAAFANELMDMVDIISRMKKDAHV